MIGAKRIDCEKTEIPICVEIIYLFHYFLSGKGNILKQGISLNSARD